MRVGDSHVYQPHEIVPVSGWYVVLTTTGEKTDETVYCGKDSRFPSIDSPRYGYLLEKMPVAQQQ